jgi:glutaredoxin
MGGLSLKLKTMLAAGWETTPPAEEPEVAGAADHVVVARGGGDNDGGEAVRRAVAESPVVVVGRRGCCLSHTVKQLLQGLGVNPAMHEVADEAELAVAVQGGEAAALPAVFVGGRLLGRRPPVRDGEKPAAVAFSGAKGHSLLEPHIEGLWQTNRLIRDELGRSLYHTHFG